MVQLFAALVLFSPAQSVTLRFMPPVGKTARFETLMDMKMTMQAMPKPMEMHQVMKMSMTAISRKGNATEVQTKVESMKMTTPKGSPMAGSSQAMENSIKNMKSTMLIGADGKPVSANSSNPMLAAMGQGMMGNQGIVFPNHPVKVGDTWTFEIDLGKVMGAVGSSLGGGSGIKAQSKLPVVFKLLSVGSQPGYGKVATVSVVTIGTMKMDMMGRQMTSKINSKGTEVIEVATGMLVSMKMTSNTVTEMGQGQSMNQKMSMAMTRLR